MIYGRRFLQFNDLVFDSYDMIDYRDTQVDMTTKIVRHNLSFTHGIYSPNKSGSMLFEPITVSITLYLSLAKLPCDYRELYRQYAISELVKPGKLWAVNNNQLMWAYAKLSNIAEINSGRKHTLEFNLSFLLPEGVWHKANAQKTFLREYDPCNFMDCTKLKKYDPCFEEKKKEDFNCCTDCVGEKKEVTKFNCNCGECDIVTKDMSLCFNKDLLQKVFDPCNDYGFQIVYDCKKGQEYFGNKFLGQKFCQKDTCSGVIAGIMYADTDIPTRDFTLTLHGHFKNPAITINDNTNVIEGDWEDNKGVLTIKNGTAYYRKDDCCPDEPVPASSWIAPQGQMYGWELTAGDNRLIIHTNSCCGIACAYMQVDGKSI